MVAHIVYIQFAGTADGHDTHQRLAQHVELGNLFTHTTCNRLGRADNLATALQVAIVTHGHHDGPCTGNQCAWTRASQGRGGVHATHPVCRHKVLEPTQLFRAVHDDRRTFRGKAILVRIARNRRHTLHTEVKGLGQEPSRLEERHKERTKTRINVATDPIALGQRTNRDHIINDTIREVRRTAHEQHRVRIDSSLDQIQTHFACLFVHRNASYRHTKVVARLVKGHMRTHRHHNLWLRNAALMTTPLPHSQARHHNRLGTTRRRRACRAFRRMVHTEHHRYHFRLHLAQARKHFRVQWIRQQEPLDRLHHHTVQRFATVVDRT